VRRSLTSPDPTYLRFLVNLFRSHDINELLFTSDWKIKITNVNQTFKKGDKCKVSNYRPVSLSSQVSTVIETILRDAIVSHLEASNLIHDSQHGFRKGRSCLTNLLVFLDKAATFVNEGHSADVIYLDFAKAFDKVPHQTSDYCKSWKVTEFRANC